MRKHPRYEDMDQQFNDLPVPDKEASWQKMQELLDKDDDDDRVVPPIFLRSCMGWGILLLTGLVVAWLLVRPDKWWNESSKQDQRSSSKQSSNPVAPKTNPLQPNAGVPPATDKKHEPSNVSSPTQSQNELMKNSAIKTANSNQISIMNRVAPRNENHNRTGRDVQSNRPVRTQSSKPNDIPIIPEKKDNKFSDTTIGMNNQQRTTIPTDTAKKESSPQPNDSVIQKKTNQPPKKIFLTAGIGEQQQIPIAGQTAVPYSHYGRKSSLSDYIPLVYLRVQKQNKWFVQAEFRYGGPQSVKEFSFSRKTDYDTTNLKITTTTQWLKKTYYHQLPLSFNYYLMPNLSVGIGGMYSRFYGAITEQEIKIQNVSAGTETIFKQIIPIKHFTDSFLYKTQVHVLMQADYRWKNLSFGLRYAKDMQPYIKFTKPDGTVDEEKNQSLQLVVRYQLWKSKKLY